MTELLTAAQMRAIEQAAIESGEVTGLELMERAGRGVVEAILEWRPELAKTAHRAVVLCGPGNNGGDGFVVARLLKERGWEVEVFLYGDEAKLPPDAAENAQLWRKIGKIGAMCEYELHADLPPHIEIDSLFGTGLTRPIEDPILWELLWGIDDVLDTLVPVSKCGRGVRGSPPLTVAIDLPSGICANSGIELGGVPPHGCRAARQLLTVTFHAPKVGHLLSDGPDYSGQLTVKDIGLKSKEPRWNDAAFVRNTHAPGNNLHHKLVTEHKYHHGHALVLSGGVGKGGAARLAARGALRVGAGLVTVGCPPAAVIENAARLDAVMLKPIADADALGEVLKDERITALCLGPGFGVGERCRDAVVEALGAKRGTVLDADALTSFAEDPAALLAQLHENCVLTPHEGEFGRLFPDILAKLKGPATKGPAYSKVDATREAAARAGCVVLFKGADTVIAGPDGRCAINSAHYERAAPWLATAGSGDVLAGFITGLLARGFGAMQAAETAAWLHVECARKFGPGLIAEDLPEQLPTVFRDLGM
ncbi:MAG: NAD(P)H-hydrate dehydratase [Pseudomonadota bacterium]